MPALFQGPGEEQLTTATAAPEVPLSTFGEEEASGASTDDLAILTPTVAPAHASRASTDDLDVLTSTVALGQVVTSVSAMWCSLWIVGGRGHILGQWMSALSDVRGHDSWTGQDAVRATRGQALGFAATS